MAKSQLKTVVVGTALLALAVTAWLMNRSTVPGEAPVGYYFYDLNDGTLYPVASNVDAPAVAPSGGEGVYAAVFACHSCADATDRFVAYLSKRSAVYLQAQVVGRELTSQEAGKSTLYRAVEGGEWMTEDQPRVKELFAIPQQRCGENATPIVCRPE